MERLCFVVGSQLENLGIAASDALFPVPKHALVVSRPIDEPAEIIALGVTQVVS
jgi:hypothetical protein